MGIAVKRLQASHKHGVSSAFLRPTRSSTPPRAKSNEGVAAKGNGGVQCYYYQCFGSFSAYCPSHVMGLSNKQPLIEDVNILQHAAPIILEVEQTSEEDVSEPEDEQPFYMFCPFFTTLEDWQRNSIFQSWVHCNGQLCYVVINGGNCTNVVSEDAAKKLGLKTEPSTSSWVDRGSMIRRFNIVDTTTPTLSSIIITRWRWCQLKIFLLWSFRGLRDLFFSSVFILAVMAFLVHLPTQWGWVFLVGREDWCSILNLA